MGDILSGLSIGIAARVGDGERGEERVHHARSPDELVMRARAMLGEAMRPG
jgi:hypothetical protein